MWDEGGFTLKLGNDPSVLVIRKKCSVPLPFETLAVGACEVSELVLQSTSFEGEHPVSSHSLSKVEGDKQLFTKAS
jgi:hypothetical protein